jgi:hypothetical protein
MMTTERRSALRAFLQVLVNLNFLHLGDARGLW